MDTPEIVHPDGFGRKVGPLPIWGWAIVLAGAVFVWFRFFGGSSSSSGASSSAASSALPNIMTTGGYLPTATATGGTTAPGFTDNQSWENAALQQASQFGTTPVQLQGALDSYLAGGTYSVQQGGWINKVIEALGAAPTGTLGTPTPAGATSTPAPSKLVAAGLFAPTFNGNYVRDQHTGLIAEVESDGSLLGLTPTEWASAAAKNGGKIDTVNHIGNAYSVAGNLQTVNG